MELAVETEAAAGNAVRPGDQQVQGEIKRSAARRVAAGAEQRHAAGRADKVIGGETRAKLRKDDSFGDAVIDCERVGDRHAVNPRRYGSPCPAIASEGAGDSGRARTCDLPLRRR